MPYRSSKRHAVAWCAATLVALAQGIVIAQRPQPPLASGRHEARPTFDLSPIVGTPSCANALDELGTVVGIGRQLGIIHGFSWSADAGLVDLGVDTNALAVNDRGEMAGQGDVSGGGLRARVWSSAGSIDVAIGVAYSLNNRTEVVGVHSPPVGDPPIHHGFRWSPAGGLIDVESLDGMTPPWSFFSPYSTTRFIRADGVMAGERGGQAVLWLLDGSRATLGTGVANSVNDRGVAAGATRPSNGQPVVWHSGSQTVITDAVGEATDINTAGYVVGWMMVAGERHGFVWHAGHGLQDLGAGQARNIDEIGDIAGCRGGDRDSRATVWRIEMTDGEYLIGFESLAARLLADVDPRSARPVFREVDLAQKALRHEHERVAQRHLRRAVTAIGDLERSNELEREWAAALQRIGGWIARRL